MPVYTDQMGEKLPISGPPQRIISLVPSQSEFLWDLGLRDRLAGITKFCIHPEQMFRSAERVGGTKNLNIDKIRQLRPDLIIGNREENDRTDIEQLKKEFPVWMSDIITLNDATKMMKELGTITGKSDKAAQIVSAIGSSMKEVQNLFRGTSVAYLIWKDPYMVAAGNTFISHLLNFTGLRNVFEHLERYPEIQLDALRDLKPEFIFLSSEPYPFKERHCRDLQDQLPLSKVILVDGEMFSWYGSRLVRSAAYFKRLQGVIAGKL